MSGAYLADVIEDGGGKPVTGATVTLLRAADFPTPPAADPGSSFYVAQTVSGTGGAFSFANIRPDDYHVMTQWEGQTVFRYFVAAAPVEVMDVKSTHGRLLAPRALQRVLGGENLTVYCIGDGVTVGYNSTGTVAGGWVNRLGLLIGAQLAPKAQVVRYDPNSYGSLTDGPIAGFTGPTTIQAASGGSSQYVQIVNCGVSGDTVQRVLRRSANYLSPAYSPVDLFVVLLGVDDSLTTDAKKFVDPESFASGIRSLLDVLKTFYPEAEVVACTPAVSNQPAAGNGGTVPAGTYALEQYAMGVRLAALDLGVALVDLRQMWADAYNAGDPNIAVNNGYGTWLNNAGGNHSLPTDAGHQAIADEIFKVFGTPGMAVGRSMRIQTGVPVNRHKVVEAVRLRNNSPGLSFAGGHWSTYTPAVDAGLLYSGSYQESSTAGDSVTFVDNMQDFALLVRRGQDCGQISVAIDGGSAVQYDLYRADPTDISDTSADEAVYPLDKLWVARGLNDSPHTVVVTVLGTHSVGSTDSKLYLDSVEYTRMAYHARRVETPNQSNLRLQTGTFSITLTGAATGSEVITFGTPFRNNLPPAMVACSGDEQWYCTVDTASETAATIRVVHRDGTNASATVTGTWIAIG